MKFFALKKNPFNQKNGMKNFPSLGILSNLKNNISNRIKYMEPTKQQFSQFIKTFKIKKEKKLPFYKIYSKHNYSNAKKETTSNITEYYLKKRRTPQNHAHPMLCFEVRSGDAKQTVPVQTNRVDLSQELGVALRDLRGLKQRELSSFVITKNIMILNILDKRAIVRHDRVQLFLEAFGEESRIENTKSLQDELHDRLSNLLYSFFLFLNNII